MKKLGVYCLIGEEILKIFNGLGVAKVWRFGGGGEGGRRVRSWKFRVSTMPVTLHSKFELFSKLFLYFVFFLLLLIRKKKKKLF